MHTSWRMEWNGNLVYIRKLMYGGNLVYIRKLMYGNLVYIRKLMYMYSAFKINSEHH